MRQGHFVARLKICGATNNLQFGFAIGHFAERQLVGVGMLVARDHLPHHNAVKRAAGFLHPLDLHAQHSDALGEFLRRPLEVHIFLEPIVSDFHFFCFLLTLGLALYFTPSSPAKSESCVHNVASYILAVA